VKRGANLAPETGIHSPALPPFNLLRRREKEETAAGIQIQGARYAESSQRMINR